MAKKTLKQEIAGTAKTGTIFFVIFELFGLLERAIDNLFYRGRVAVRKAVSQPKAKKKQPKVKTTKELDEFGKKPGEDFWKAMEELPAGEQLEMLELLKELKKEVDEKMKKDVGQ